ncbi:MAG: 2-C-methyl-D-erythritol 4-phosphate cytidylyltransferase [Treponema sp.]|jgi:2-C-methyl-D-erythritol 4-phosphate cytidylyltransferase|nr:2-C-methyl-D-erythritol 4-phosphate cytidylyltransferase [Treponema sp.]
MEYPATDADRAAIATIICAAGSSLRMKGLKKEYRPLPDNGGLTVLGAAVLAFAPLVETVVIAVPADDESGEAAARRALPTELLSAGKPRILFVPGGKTRRASVHHALSLLAACPPRYVLIHDGARPWIGPALIKRVIDAVQKYRAVIPLLPLTETPKETDSPLEASGPVFIKQHLRRSNTGAAQTPQAFDFPEILSAHERAAGYERDGNVEYTDDAEVWGAFIGPVAVIPGSPENRKITFPEDLW